MDATTTALARIADALQPTPQQTLLDGAQVVGVAAAMIAVFVALAALRSERTSRSNESLLRLVEYHDANQFFIRMWRLEQVSRVEDVASVGRVSLSSLTRHPKEVVANLATAAFANDWSQYRADMYAVYFFALRVNAWLTNPGGGSRRQKIRKLNDTFGHQLLSTFINHWMLACRVHNPAVTDDYYPSHYGLFDSRYRDLVEGLSDDLLSDARLQEAVRQPIEQQLRALRAYTDSLTSLESAVDLPPAEELGRQPA